MKSKTVATTVIFSLALAACGQAPNPAAADVGASQAGDMKKPATTQALPSAGGGAMAPLNMAGVVADPAIHCSLDSINGTVSPSGYSLARGAEIAFSGWIANQENKVPERSFVIIKNDQNAYVAFAPNDFARPDVQKMLTATGSDKYGFNANSSLLEVAPGNYLISLGVDRSGVLSLCDTSAKLTVGVK